MLAHLYLHIWVVRVPAARRAMVKPAAARGPKEDDASVSCFPGLAMAARRHGLGLVRVQGGQDECESGNMPWGRGCGPLVHDFVIKKDAWGRFTG